MLSFCKNKVKNLQILKNKFYYKCINSIEAYNYQTNYSCVLQNANIKYFRIWVCVCVCASVCVCVCVCFYTITQTVIDLGT